MAKEQVIPQNSGQPVLRSARLASLAIPVALFLTALVVRCIGLKWGLPNEQRWYSYHPDEADIAIAVSRLDFFNGEFNPKFYNYPSLFIYCTYLAHMVAGVVGATHVPRPGDTAIWPYLFDILLAGRAMTALFGAATVPLVYAIGRRLAGPGVAWLAAVLMVLTPGHIQHSHFATVDVPATFFVTLALWLAVRAVTDTRPSDDADAIHWQTRQILFSAVAAGLAAATKYNAGLVIVAPLLALWLCSRRETAWRRRLVAIGLGILLAGGLSFIAGCPGSVLYTREFLGDGKFNGLLYELFVHSRQGSGDLFIGSGNGWWYHLTFNLPFLMTWPLLVAALVGVALALKLQKSQDSDAVKPNFERHAALILLAWLAVAFITTGVSQVRFMRYMLPLTPALCILAGKALLLPLRGVATLPRRAIALALTLVAALGSFNILYSFAATDPRDAATEYMKREVTAPTTVGLFGPPWFWSPPLSPQDAPPNRRQAPAPTSPDGKFRFVFTGIDAAQLKAQRPEWFVLSEFEWTDKERLQDAAYGEFAKALGEGYELVREWKHHPPGELPGRRFVPHDYLYPNPGVRVYRRRDN